MEKNDMWEPLQFEFMRNALIAGVLVSISCGLIGSLVVVNRIVFISGGIAHAAYGGIGLAVFLGFSPTLGAGAFAITVSIIMAAVSFRNRERADTVIGVLWAVGMAIGIILIDLSPGYGADLMGYLFGSILAVSQADLRAMFTMDVLIVMAVMVFYKEFLAVSYDEEFSFVAGIPVRPLYFGLLVMTALCVIMVIRVVGLILVIALLAIPPYIAEKYTRSLGRMMILSSVFGIFFTLTGLWLSFYLNVTSGATIVLVAGVAFFAAQALETLRKRHRARSPEQ